MQQLSLLDFVTTSAPPQVTLRVPRPDKDLVLKLTRLTQCQSATFNYLIARHVTSCRRQGVDPFEDWNSVIKEAIDDALCFSSVSEAKAFYATPKQRIHCHQHYSVYDRPRGAYL